MATAQQQEMYNCGSCPGGPLIILNLTDLIKKCHVFYLLHLSRDLCGPSPLSSEVMKKHPSNHFFFHASAAAECVRAWTATEIINGLMANEA